MIYTIANQKGGIGKSTTAAAIVSGATLRGKTSLAVDCDPQGNLSVSMDGDLSAPGIYDIMTGTARAADVIQHTEQGDLIAGNPGLASADTVLTGDRRTKALKQALKPILAQYDVVCIDTPPTLNTVLINALTAAESVIIPAAADSFTLQGLSLLIQTITETKRKYNRALTVAGILFTRYSARTNIARIYTEEIRKAAESWNVPVFNSTIRGSVKIQEAQTMRESIFEYSPRSGIAEDYAALLDELNI